MEELSLRQKSLFDLVRQISAVKPIAKRWYLHAGLKFLQNRELTDEQETFLEEITDFYIENLMNIEKDKEFIRKITLDPITLPMKKQKVKS